jgi:hypothetical protein
MSDQQAQEYVFSLDVLFKEINEEDIEKSQPSSNLSLLDYLKVFLS